MKKKVLLALLCAALAAGTSVAQTNLALKSARETSTYYAFAVGIADAVMQGAPGVNITEETSAGSEENVKMARMRKDFMFTSPPNLVGSALAAEGQFKEGGYDKIRSLWPIPGLVMHWVVRQDSGVQSLADLAGKRFVPGGAGSAGEQITRKVLGAVGVEGKVELLTIDLSEGVPAVRNRRAVGFGTSSTPPASMIQEIAATIPMRFLELSDADYSKVKDLYTRATLPAGMYPGMDKPVKTVSQPVALYTTSDLPEETAYRLTKAFWAGRAKWEAVHPAMKLITMDDVNAMVARLHPGALRYYQEAGFAVAPGLR